MNEYKEADSCYNRALELQPGMFLAYLNMGQSKYFQNNFSEAV
jgi:Flp pilus assembly protein TadD